MTPFAAFGAAVLLVALAELGDKSQLLALMLVMRYSRPVALVAGMGAGVLANHVLAAALGMTAFQALPRAWVEGALILAFLLMAVWLLGSSEEDEAASPSQETAPGSRRGSAFLAAAGLFFLAEMGDKTQLMALGLGARFETILPVVLGSVTGVLLVNAPVFWGGEWLAARISMVWARRGAAALCLLLAALTAWV
jgi:putative Ca2+/H+ antiporter (TMEM165/GDT1 family)